MHETNPLINSIQSSRITYRIDPQKLAQYHARHTSKPNGKSISTQTIFGVPRDSCHQITSEKRNEIEVRESLSSLNSSSLSTTLPTNNAIDNSTSSCFDINFPNDFVSEVSQKTNSQENDEYYFSNYLPQSRATNPRLYIRSIYQYMFANDISNENED